MSLVVVVSVVVLVVVRFFRVKHKDPKGNVMHISQEQKKQIMGDARKAALEQRRATKKVQENKNKENEIKFLLIDLS